MDLPSPSRVKELGGPLQLPSLLKAPFGATLVGAAPDPERWSGYSLSIERDPSPPNAEVLVIERPKDAGRVIELAGLWGPLHFVSVSTDVVMASSNLLRSAAYVDPVLPGGHRWTVVDAKRSHLTGIPAAYNAARNSTLAGNASGYWNVAIRPNDIVVFLHDDVHLLPNFELSIYEQVHRLNGSDVDAHSWCGIAMASARVRQEGRQAFRGEWLEFGMTPLSLPMQESAQEARLVPDEAMIVTLRGSSGQFDSKMSEFHCFGADFAFSCLAADKFVHATDTFVASHKAWHAGGALVQYNPDFTVWQQAIDWVALARAGKFVTEKWMHTLDLRSVDTTACVLDKSILP
ncbi:hypothetical protein FNF29_04916 [Cafeteria roenbergensis]|uniref:Uncharacterized protein n=1 Tax=Cafeteria roenbergensis TaxID=33653 RepID=A0A5A8CEI0_CAFRO|nr:hypothetical protein FNF29_04916 [Cafeteria roenbergensis]|eukprot:KAA0151027.1 hypothetical protein FNF29_04916 [Cafeteria roenbergensis]